jgi:hypothetical protein
MLYIFQQKLNAPKYPCDDDSNPHTNPWENRRAVAVNGKLRNGREVQNHAM